MTYYILLNNDSVEDIWDENILGEESFGTFYTGNGFKALSSLLGLSQTNKIIYYIFEEQTNLPIFLSTIDNKIVICAISTKLYDFELTINI